MEFLKIVLMVVIKLAFIILQAWILLLFFEFIDFNMFFIFLLIVLLYSSIARRSKENESMVRRIAELEDSVNRMAERQHMINIEIDEKINRIY